ncbi:MAG TPA: AAA family ATPase, partial [Polyangiaceae bacterium]|nr:AAA family ATPase [Polyangiaceae bacterium]
MTDLSPSAIDRSSLASLAGTPLYMSPEHATGQLLTMASDWYCVGLMMYKALTGLVPHEEYAGNVFQLLLMRQQKAPTRPGELEPSVPPDLDALCARLLLRDPAGRPSGREVVEHLGRTRAVSAASSARPPAQVEPPAFVGREGELAALREALREARGGRAVVASVVGQSGVGKSRLVQRFLEEVAGGDGAIVLTGRCWEGESVPYKAIVGLVDNLRRHLRQIAHGPGGEAAVERLLPRDVWALARLFPSLQRVGAVARAPRRGGEGAEPRELRRRAFAAARELFARMSDQAPVVLHVDDLQWGDRDSAELLSEVLRGPGAPPLCVLLTCRSGDREQSSFFRALAPEAGDAAGPSRRSIEVGPLPPADAEALAQRLLRGAGSEAVARAIALESGGSPIFLQQLACDLDDRPDGPRSEGRPDPRAG